MKSQQKTVTYRPTGKDTEKKLRAAAKRMGITVNKFIDRAVTEQIIRHALNMPNLERYELLKLVVKYDGDRVYHTMMLEAMNEFKRLQQVLNKKEPYAITT